MTDDLPRPVRVQDSPHPPRAVRRANADLKGYVLAAVAATLWACSGNIGKFVMQQGVSPVELAQGRTFVAVACLFAYLVVLHLRALGRRRAPVGRRADQAVGNGGGARPAGDSDRSRGDRSPFSIPRSTWAWLAAFGLFLGLVQFFYFAAIDRIEVAAAILLEYLAPAVVVAFAWAVQRRPAGRATLGALVAAIVGCALVIRAYDPVALRLSTVGVIFGLGAAITFAAYILIGEHLQAEVPVPARLFYGFSAALLVLFVLQPPWRVQAAAFGPKALLGVLVVGTLGTLAPFTAFMASLRCLDAGRATITSTLEPVVAGFIAFFWFGETFAPLQLVGAALVIGAVVALQRRSPVGEVIAEPEAIAGPDAAV